jgi:hypothetical protein
MLRHPSHARYARAAAGLLLVLLLLAALLAAFSAARHIQPPRVWHRPTLVFTSPTPTLAPGWWQSLATPSPVPSAE